MDVFSSPAFDEHEQVDFFYDRGQRAEGDRRLARHDARAGGRRLSHVAVCDRGRGGHRRAAARQGHDLQGRDGRPAVRRRQDGDHRRSQDRQVARRCSARSAARSTASAAATTPARTSAPAPRTWTGPARRPRYVLGRTRSGGSGDPSPVTARGVWLGIRAAVRHKLQRERSRGRPRGDPGPGPCRLQPRAAARPGRRPPDRRRPRPGARRAGGGRARRPRWSTAMRS